MMRLSGRTRSVLTFRGDTREKIKEDAPRAFRLLLH